MQIFWRQISKLAAITRTKMAPSVLHPPASVRGMTVLDRSAFTKDVQLPCLRLNAHLLLLPAIMAALKKQTVKITKMKAIQPADTASDKLCLLDPAKVATWEDIEG